MDSSVRRELLLAASGMLLLPVFGIDYSNELKKVNPSIKILVRLLLLFLHQKKQEPLKRLCALRAES
ncbi:hypothetical protein [Legionella waltersii]|uniref:hypothetical protein n=1 Tax=Legionella waltersii TaxID=66969 RepID=UPI000AA2658B|nr:hypothetical protein [Legionella waltersii]